MSDIRRDILWRVYLVFVFVCVFGAAILFQVVRLQVWEGAYWRAKADSLTLAYRHIDAARGSIYAADGSLLGTSIPVYELHLDAANPAVTDEIFFSAIDSLSLSVPVIP